MRMSITHNQRRSFITRPKALSFHLCTKRLNFNLQVRHLSFRIGFRGLSFHILHRKILSLSEPPYLEEGSRPSEETPLYVNAKQFERMLKRRLTGQRLEERLGCTPGRRRPYCHESRHKHAIRRLRGPGGRFLTKDELERPVRNKDAIGNASSFP